MPSEIEALTAQVRLLGERVREEKQAKRSSNRRMSVVIALLVLLGAWGQWTNSSRIDDIIEVRNESRQVSCNDRQVMAMAHNFLVFGIVTRNFTRPVPDDLANDTRLQLVPVPDCSSPSKVKDVVTGQTTPTKPEFPEIPEEP